LAHGREEDAVAEFDVLDLEGREKSAHG
jgi:hypothetical protein